MQDAKNRHLRTIVQLCRAISSQLRRVSTIGKTNLLSSNMSSRCPPQYGELSPTSGWDRSCSLELPANFNGFRVLAALLHSSQVVSVSQTLLRWTEGATCVQQGDHHVGHWPTFLVTCSIARSANLPVFNLLRGRFWGFSPCRVDMLHRWGLNLAWRRGPKVPSSTPNFTPIGATTTV